MGYSAHALGAKARRGLQPAARLTGSCTRKATAAAAAAAGAPVLSP